MSIGEYNNNKSIYFEYRFIDKLTNNVKYILYIYGYKKSLQDISEAENNVFLIDKLTV